jgi:quercetin dioxygenase-like cupin family protein
MSTAKLILMLVCLMPVATEPKEAKVTSVFSKDLADLPGKEGLMLVVEYPPGNTDPIHRHNAHGFIYVLEGSIVMQVRGGKEVTLTPGTAKCFSSLRTDFAWLRTTGVAMVGPAKHGPGTT